MRSIPFYVKRFVSGGNYTEAFQAVQSLNNEQICVTLDLLGENITEKAQAEKFCAEYHVLLQQIHEQKKNCYLSIKLTMLGLDVEEAFCLENLRSLLKLADSLNIRVAFDMEGSAYTERTISIYENMSKEFQSPEIVLQAYLYRTEKDLNRVLNANGKLRLCKGAYKENADVAFQKMPLIVDNYKKLIQKALISGKRICIATHDDELIDFCKSFILENKIPQERYEFQMLYGLRSKTRSKIREEGHNMTVYVPYGQNWQGYYKRRLSERKENIFFVLKNFFKR